MWEGGGSSSPAGSFSGGSPNRKEREREIRLACSSGTDVTGRLRRGGRGQSPLSWSLLCVRVATLLLVLPKPPPAPALPATPRLLLLLDRAEAELWRGAPVCRGGRHLALSELWSTYSWLWLFRSLLLFRCKALQR